MERLLTTFEVPKIVNLLAASGAVRDEALGNLAEATFSDDDAEDW